MQPKDQKQTEQTQDKNAQQQVPQQTQEEKDLTSALCASLDDPKTVGAALKKFRA